MTGPEPSIINVAIVGGNQCCRDVLERTTLDFNEKGVNARFKAVVDVDPESPGIKMARESGLITLSHYHDLYKPEYEIHLIIIITPDEAIFEDILKTRPPHIRIMSYQIFQLFWHTIRSEERKLRGQNIEMKTILDGIQDFILVITPEMEIVEANDAFLSKMGYCREEVIGKKCYEVYNHLDHPCNRPEEPCPLNEVIRNKRRVKQLRSRSNPKGVMRYFEADIYPVWEKDGKISKFIHISRDITKRKLEEERITRRLEQMVEERTRQLKETHEQLLHQDKMASLGKLAASVVHEINNPIAGILNLLMLIRRINEEGPITEKERDQFKHYINLMETETRRISRIVSNLLSFSRQSKMEFREVDVNHLVETTLFINANLLKIKRVKVQKDLATDIPKLVGSEDQLEQVFMNLVSNAAEAIDGAGGGTLSIESRFEEAEGRITVTFSDTGIGIPQENIPRLFEPFFTTKKKGKGVGLGLSVAYGIVKEHGGCIQIDSEVGKGTRFTIQLPLKTANPEKVTEYGKHQNSDC